MNHYENEIQGFYAMSDEAGRLDGLSLEKLRSQEIIARQLGPAPQVILDCGGGPGAYAFWLAGLGHELHLLDASERHVTQARAASDAAVRPLASIQTGDARRLPFSDGRFDLVLLMGPLYHLTSADDRIKAIAEARRVLKPGGVLVAAIISRFASMLDGFFGNLVADPDYVPMMRRDLASGVHRNPEGKPYFTTAYLQRPDEFRAELAAGGFTDPQVLAIEGFADALPDLPKRLEEPRFRDILFETLRQIETEESILGASSHIMGVGRKAEV